MLAACPRRSLNIMATVVTYSAAISACSTAASWQCAIHLFNELLQLEQHEDSRGPFGRFASNSVAFNAAIIACEKGNQWKSALNLMHVMHSRQLQLDLITCNAVVNACSCSFRWAEPTFHSCFMLFSLVSLHVFKILSVWSPVPGAPFLARGCLQTCALLQLVLSRRELVNHQISSL